MKNFFSASLRWPIFRQLRYAGCDSTLLCSSILALFGVFKVFKVCREKLVIQYTRPRVSLWNTLKGGGDGLLVLDLQQTEDAVVERLDDVGMSLLDFHFNHE